MRLYSYPYKEISINSAFLEIPAEYQRKLQMSKIKQMVAEFNGIIVNPPKVSYRDGRYIVIDGQHTIMGLLAHPLPGLRWSDQRGRSSRVCSADWRIHSPFCGLRSWAASSGRSRRSGAGATVCLLQARCSAKEKQDVPDAERPAIHTQLF